MAAIAAGHSVEDAAEAIHAGRRTVYHWRHQDEDFARAWDDARDACADRMEAVMTAIALNGDTEALKFMLRARKPETYNPNLLIRRQMLQLALAKARAEAAGVLTIEGNAAERVMIYPTQARLELPRLLGKDGETADFSESTADSERTIDNNTSPEEDAA